MYRFTRGQCDGCPLVRRCVAKPGQGAFGRTVQKSDYETEYRRARERATTAAYAAVRSEHAAVERKLNEVLNHHDGRHARYWGLAKVHAQECLTCFTVNVKRMVKLSPPPIPPDEVPKNKRPPRTKAVLQQAIKSAGSCGLPLNEFSNPQSLT